MLVGMMVDVLHGFRIFYGLFKTITIILHRRLLLLFLLIIVIV